MRRIVFALAIATCASPAFAVQDRYGPPRSAPSGGPRTVQLPAGALLDWRGKAAPQAIAPEPAALTRPEPLAPWAERMAPRPAEVAAPAVARPSAAPGPTPIAAQATPLPPALPQQVQATPVPQPTVIAAQAMPLAPAPAQQVRAASTPVHAQRPFAPAPAPIAADPAPLPPAPPQQVRFAPPPVATAQAPGAAARPRFYSVSRQYGAQPDPIPVSTVAPRGQALTLSDVPTSENLGRTQAPLDDGRANQAVPIPVTKENAAADRANRIGL